MILLNIPISLLVAAVSVQWYADHVSHENYALLRIAFLIIFVVCFTIGLLLNLWIMKGFVPAEEKRPSNTYYNNTGSSLSSWSNNYPSVPPPNPPSNWKSDWDIRQEKNAEQRKSDQKELSNLESRIAWAEYHDLDKSDMYSYTHETNKSRVDELRYKVY